MINLTTKLFSVLALTLAIPLIHIYGEITKLNNPEINKIGKTLNIEDFSIYAIEGRLMGDSGYIRVEVEFFAKTEFDTLSKSKYKEAFFVPHNLHPKFFPEDVTVLRLINKDAKDHYNVLCYKGGYLPYASISLDRCEDVLEEIATSVKVYSSVNNILKSKKEIFSNFDNQVEIPQLSKEFNEKFKSLSNINLKRVNIKAPGNLTISAMTSDDTPLYLQRETKNSMAYDVLVKLIDGDYKVLIRHSGELSDINYYDVFPDIREELSLVYNILFQKSHFKKINKQKWADSLKQSVK